MSGTKSNLPTFLHWFSWTISLVASIFFAFFLIGEGIPDILHDKGKDLIPLVPLLLLAIAGCAVSFFKQKYGAIMMLVAGIAMVIFQYIHGGMAEFGMMVVYGLPYIFPGIILLIIKR